MRLREFDTDTLSSVDYERMLTWLTKKFSGEDSNYLNKLVQMWDSGERNALNYNKLFHDLDTDLDSVLKGGLTYGED